MAESRKDEEMKNLLFGNSEGMVNEPLHRLRQLGLDLVIIATNNRDRVNQYISGKKKINQSK